MVVAVSSEEITMTNERLAEIVASQRAVLEITLRQVLKSMRDVEAALLDGPKGPKGRRIAEKRKLVLR
jgi:hypothetical protein